MKFTSFVLLNIVIITNILAVKNKQKKKGGRVSTNSGNKNQKDQKQNKISKDENKEKEFVENKDISTDKGLKQNGVGSDSSPANTVADDKSDNDERLNVNDNENLDPSKTSKSELDDTTTIEESGDDLFEDTLEATSPNVAQSPVLDNQEENVSSNNEGVSNLNSTTNGNIVEPETDGDTKTVDPSKKSTSDQKVEPVEDQNANKNKKIEDGTDNSTKQSEVKEKENAINTPTVASEPAEVVTDGKNKETTLEKNTPKEVVTDNNNKEATLKTSTPKEVDSDSANKETSKPNTSSAEVVSDKNNKETSKPDTSSAEVVSDNNKPTTKKTDTLDSNAGHKSTEVTSNTNPTTSETSKVITPSKPNGPPNDENSKNNSIEESKKSNPSKLGKYLLWGSVGVCGVGLAVCMVLLVSSK